MLKVLVFESDASFASELRHELEARGCAVTVVDDASAGLQAAASDRPDLILLTIELPRMNGFSVCNKLKRIENLKDVPLIILSSDATDETFEQHRRLRTRAEDYVHKPIAFADLEARISALVALDGSGAAPSDDGEDLVVEDEIAFDDGDLEPPLEDEGPRSLLADDDDEVNQETERAFSILVHDEPPRRDDTQAAAPPAVSVEDLPRPPFADVAAESDRARAASLVPESQPGPRRKGDEIQKLQRALDEARAKAGSTARDFLELREQLNKKDKETLDLRDQVTNRDKELLSLRDANLSQERDKTDLNDKLLDLDKQIHELERTNKAAKADKDQAAKRAEDHKKRGERLSTELDALGLELTSARAAHTTELASARAAHTTELTTLRSELTATLEKHAQEVETQSLKEASLNAEHQQALEALRAEAAATLHDTTERLQAEKVAELGARTDEATREKAEALAERERQLGEEHSNNVAELVRAHEEAVAQMKTHHQTAIGEIVETLSALRQRHELARGKWNEDRASLDRAKQALETALQQIAEAQGHSFE